MEIQVREDKLGVNLRCAYCHGPFAGIPILCGRCGTRLHRECSAQLLSCPSLGCGQPMGMVRPPRPPRRRRRWLALGAFGLACYAVVGFGMWWDQHRRSRAALAWSNSTVLVESPEPALPLPLRHVLGSLADPDASVRLGALIELGKRQVEVTPVTWGPVVHCLQGDSERRVRVVAARLLGRMAAPQTAKHLRRALDEDEDMVALAAARALARLGSAGVPHLIQALHDERAWVRSVAAEALGQAAPADAARAKAALTAARADVSWIVRQQVGRSLARLARSRSPAPPD